MSCYVDPAAWPFGRMLMCHLWADSMSELFAMVDTIGVQRKWLQQPPKASWVHFDISKGKRALAVAAGAIETDKYGPVVHCAILDLLDPFASDRERARALRKLDSVLQLRGQPPMALDTWLQWWHPAAHVGFRL